MASPELLDTVLQHYGLKEARCTALAHGHINATWRVEAAGRGFVLQRLHPIFGIELQDDFQQISAHLRRHGLLAPELLPTTEGALWVRLPAAAAPPPIWRLQTLLPGEPLAFATPAVGAAAGHLLGRVHAALRSFAAPLRAARQRVHDVPRHLGALRDALTQPPHPADGQIRPVAEAILQAALALPSLDGPRCWVVHGDPKLSNFLFAAAPAAPQAVALVDFDTFNRMPLCMELGDALRSWCNAAAEDEPHSRFDLDIFAAALAGYAAGLSAPLQEEEIAALGHAAEAIALELAARFARDAIEESYFGWDRSRFAASWEHQLRRARGQLALAQSHARQGAAIRRVVRQVFVGRRAAAP